MIVSREEIAPKQHQFTEECEMKRFRFLALFMAFLMVATPVFAQRPQPDPTIVDKPSSAVPAPESRARLKPFTTENMIARVDYAKAIKECDRRVLNVNCEQFVEIANRRFKLGLNLSELSTGAARTEVATFIENLDEVPCAQSRSITLAAAMPNGDIKENGITRTMKVNERCLFDRGHGMWVASLMCGNFITDDNLTGVFTGEQSYELRVPFGDQARNPNRDFGNPNDSREPKSGTGSNFDKERARYGWWDPRGTSGKVVIGSAAALGICFGAGWCRIVENTAVAKVIINNR